MIRLFMDSEYDVVTAESGAKALEILEDQEFDIVISDMRMPIMDGYELLERVKERYPKTIRIILSGYSDEKIIFQALQRNIAKLYIFKPWENEMLLQQINHLLEIEDILTQTNLLTLINDTVNLPTLKQKHQRIVRLIEEDKDIEVIAAEIEQDLSISAKILKVANSAFYGVRTGSVKQAVTYLGLQNVKQLVTSISMVELFQDMGVNQKFMERIWEHSCLSNKLLIFLYEKHLNKKIPEEYSCAALLHNIGMLFFLKYFYDEYIGVLVKSKMQERILLNLEREIFLVSHNEVGAYLLDWWELPYAVVETALLHNKPLDEKVVHKEIVCAVHIVIKYAEEMIGDKWEDEFDERAFEMLHISQNEFEASLLNFF